MKQVCSLYSCRRPLRAVALADWEAIHYKDYHGDHAGRCETSQLWALLPEMVDISRIPDTASRKVVFASTSDARHSSRIEGEAIVASQVAFLERQAGHLLAAAETQPPSERISWEQTEQVWQEMLAERAAWISSHSPEGFHAYVRKRVELFPLPIN